MTHLPARTLAMGAAGVVLLGLVAFFGYQYVALRSQLTAVRSDLSSTTAAYASTTASLAAELAESAEEKTTLSTALSNEQQKTNAYEGTVKKLSSTVGTLTKLTTIDPQLLAKYSKVYFLNENYVPAKLAPIPTEETYDHKRTYTFESQALPFLDSMIKDATEDDVHLLVVSAYRSFGEQSSLKASYKRTYGAGTANSFSADQGYSEHQLGTTIDFTTEKLGANFTNFDKTDEYEWLLNNAYHYGFIISYPQTNAYYTYEPWHWRFVGIELATKLHHDKAYFYDLDQRDINSYLVLLFDK